MFRKIVSAIMLSLLVTSMLILAFRVQSVRADAGTIYINADGSVTGTTSIQTADNVTYVFTANISDPIIVQRDNVTIDGNGYTLQGAYIGYGDVDLTGINLEGRTNVTVQNTTIEGFYYGIDLSFTINSSVFGNNLATNYIGIYLNSPSSSSITRNNITANTQSGIELDSSSNNNGITGNNITNNGDGIDLYSSSNSSINGNNIMANSGDGIYLDFSSDNNISGNTFIECGLDVYVSYNNSVKDNTVNGEPLVYLEGVTGYSVGDAGQVVLVKCDGTRVENLNISNASEAVELWETNNSIISHNNLIDNLAGIVLGNSSNNSVTGNNITSNGDGIDLYSSSSNNSVGGNHIANNGYGVVLGQASSNVINGNNIMANSGDGIYLGHSSNNSIIGDNLTANGCGIYLGPSSSSNSIYHDNFVNNTLQVLVYSGHNPIAPPLNNMWDDGYPSGGNYWSDYNGTDNYSGPYQNTTGSDGIGDSAYVIAPYVTSSINIDHYPLMNPWTHLAGDLNGDGKVDLTDLVLLAQAYGSKPGDPNWNPNADIAPPYGVVGLTDLVTLAMHYGQHYP